MQYIALIHRNTSSTPTPEEWRRFIEVAAESGMFRGGSVIGNRHHLGDKDVSVSTSHVGGYMRFDADELSSLKELLKQHPVIKHGGAIELCEMPES